MKADESEAEKPREVDLWDKTKKAAKKALDWIMRYPLALIISVFVVLAAVVFVAIGKGDKIDVGGILGKLFGTDKKDENRVVKANKVPDKRVDEDGNPIPKGEEGEEGYVQREVDVLQHSKNPFRNQSKIKIKSDGKEKEIYLPEGVKDKDVDKVYQVKPKVYKVETKKSPDTEVRQEDIEHLK